MWYENDLKLFSNFGVIHAAVVTFIVLLITTLLYFFYRRFTAKGNTILIVGLNDSGKTVLFGKLINSENVWSTYTSITPNIYPHYIGKNGAFLNLVDIPGADSLRKTYLEKWLINQKNKIKGIIFVIDSAAFSEKRKDVAETLYNIFYDSSKSIPVLVACNKQDIQLKAQSSKLIASELEKEFGLINLSRLAALSSTSGDSTKKLLTKNGKDFNWNNFKKSNKLLINFVQCSALEDKISLLNDELSINSISNWIDAL